MGKQIEKSIVNRIARNQHLIGEPLDKPIDKPIDIRIANVWHTHYKQAGTAWPAHDTCTADALQTHGRREANAWQTRCQCMAKSFNKHQEAWHNQGKRKGNAQCGKRVGNAWHIAPAWQRTATALRQQGKCGANPWETHRKSKADAW